MQHRCLERSPRHCGFAMSLLAVVFLIGLGQPPLVSAAGLVTSLSVNDAANAADWSVQSSLAIGNTQYGDRAYAFNSVPAGFAGAEWIRTANDSKAFTGSILASFSVTADTDVYVAFNDSIGTKPGWLSSANGWTDSGSNLVNSESSPKTFSLFKRTFPANATVALGNNGSTSSSVYTVVVRPAGILPPVTGTPVLPPKWAFGVLYGSYHNQAQVLDDMSRLRASYSGDLYWIDSSWLSGSYTGTPERYICYQFDPGQFPDAAGMIATLRQNHFHFGVWEWPWIDQGCQFFGHGDTNHLFVENTSHNPVDAGGWHGNTFTGAFDYTNPATVSWWRTLNQPLVDMGLSFFKLDTGGGYPSAGVLHDGSNSQDKYKTLYRKTGYDVSATANGGRGFVLTHRQKSTDADQYPGMWTGDTTATFDGLIAEMKRAAALNTPSTTAFWCGDTGGYNKTPTDELYIRWLEYTTWTPCQEFFGAKTTSTGARFPWMFSTQAQGIFKTHTQLRYRLLPFRYSNAQIAFHNKPVQYPVRWIGQTQIVNGAGDSQILVQPITAAGATNASVKLPAGSWIDYWTGTVYAGNATHTVPAPIDRVPTLVKAGSIIPMGPDLRWVDEKPADPLTLDIYPSGSTSYTLYEDDGVSAAYKTGAVSKTTFSCDASGAAPVVSIGASTGTYDGELAARTYILKINKQAADPGTVMRDGVAVTRFSTRADFDAASEGWFYDAAKDVVWVKFRIATSSATSVAL
jgi:alpha-glucosidase (family GH31 glycosyl hydrolase)